MLARFVGAAMGKSYDKECLDRAEKGLTGAYENIFKFQLTVQLAHSVLTDSNLTAEDRVFKAISILAKVL